MQFMINRMNLAPATDEGSNVATVAETSTPKKGRKAALKVDGLGVHHAASDETAPPKFVRRGDQMPAYKAAKAKAKAAEKAAAEKVKAKAKAAAEKAKAKEKAAKEAAAAKEKAAKERAAAKAKADKERADAKAARDAEKAAAKAAKAALPKVAVDDNGAAILATLLAEFSDGDMQALLQRAFDAGRTYRKRAPRAPRREGPTKSQIAAGLLQREGGCTRKDILDATGWPSVSVQDIAKANGLTLTQTKDGRVTTYVGVKAN